MKTKFDIITSTCVPLPLENVDTDQIIPARFLKATTREEKFFGDNLFRRLALSSGRFSEQGLCFEQSHLRWTDSGGGKELRFRFQP